MDDKLAALYDIVYNFKNYEQEAIQIRDRIVQVHPQARNVLDVACGTGKHAEYLKHEFQMDGLDLNPAYVEIAKSRNSSGQYFQGDMTQFQLSRQYDVIICLFSAIGLVV